MKKRPPHLFFYNRITTTTSYECYSYPGTIQVDMNREEINLLLGRERFENWVPLDPLERIDNVNEVAKVVVLLSSSAKS